MIVNCPKCNGSGWDETKATDCARCEGSGEIKETQSMANERQAEIFSGYSGRFSMSEPRAKRWPKKTKYRPKLIANPVITSPL